MEASDFRNGVTFVCDGQPCQVIEFQHVKPGKGAAFVRTKYKNIITGAIRETSFNPTAKFESAFIERKDMDYSYKDGNLYYFMDQETYEMIPVDESVVGDEVCQRRYDMQDFYLRRQCIRSGRTGLCRT